MNLQSKAQSRRLYEQRGQGMTEYIIIVALIAISAIAVYQLFGTTVRNQTAGIAQELAGGNGETAIGVAKQAGSDAEAAAGKKRGLDTFGNQQGEGSKGTQ